MRKIYSLVLMTAMLLVGTNVWAVEVTTEDALRQQIANAVSTCGTVTITLGQNISLTDTPLQIHIPKSTYQADPTTTAAPNITLDLNGNNIETTTATYMIELYKGTLNITGTGKITNKKAGGDVIWVFGSPNSTAENWSNLTIGENVTIISEKSNGVVVDGFVGRNVYMFCFSSGTLPNYMDPSVVYWEETSKTPYASTSGTDRLPNSVAYSSGTKSVVNKIDVAQKIDLGYGTTYPVTDADNRGYAVKPGMEDTEANREPVYRINYYEAYAFGANIIINGTVYGGKYGVKANGYLKSNTGNVPYILINTTANIYCPPTASGTTAIYSSGYAHWDIRGYVHGNIGAYIKSGDVDITGAIIVSENPTATTVIGTNGGISGGSGNAIVVESNSNYCGGQDVTISGDAQITGNGGCAITEVDTRTPTQKEADGGDKVEAITINGGTINGGAAGAISVVTDEKTTIYSGNVTGAVETSGGQGLQDIIPTSGVHETTVNGVVVISEGAAPTGQETVMGGVASVNWKHNDASTASMTETIKANIPETDTVVTLTELEINQSYAQTLTIKAGSTLKVGKVILGTKAIIIIEPTAKLIVTGEEGIYSLKDDNIVLQANADNQALFVIAPNVSSNRQPHATIQYVSKAYEISSSEHKWERFSTPVCVTTKPDNNSGSFDPAISYVDGDTKLNTYVNYLNETTQTWEHATKWSDLRPFRACEITNNVPSGTQITYSFKGKLMGNVTDSISRQNGHWNYYGNSYMAPISVKALLDTFATQPISKTIYTWKMGGDRYQIVNETYLKRFADANEWYIPTMGFFATKNNSGIAGKMDINYRLSIFDYAINPTSYTSYSAPTRMGDVNTVRINISSENGQSDFVCFVESNSYSAEFEDGEDAEKLMGRNMNLYVSEEDANYAMLATDNILGTMISLQTSEDINYTLTFDKVFGEVYALRDNMTNAVVLMNEGATYNFTAQSNATLDGRFQIVSRQEMPTAVETIEETVASKAIYTVMGQYVGETTDWNTLPAGVYVVDGVKIVK